MKQKEDLNRLVQLADGMNARRVLSTFGQRLTNRQKALLQDRMQLMKKELLVEVQPPRTMRLTSSIKRGSRIPTSASAPSALIETIRAEMARMLTRTGLSNLVSQDPRATASYNYLYASLGCPNDMPLPLPFCHLLAGKHKYAFATGGSAPKVFTVPIGEKMIFINDPLQFHTPLRAGLSGVGGDNWQTTANDFDRLASITSYAASDLFDNAGWKGGFAPFEPYADANCIKSAANGTVNLPTAEVHPPLVQCMGVSMHWQVNVPYQGQCVVYPFSPGNNPEKLNAGGYNTAYNVSSALQVGDGFRGAHYTPQYSNAAAVTPEVFAQSFTLPVVCVGGNDSANMCGVIRGSPMHNFCYAGQLDIIDDVGATTSAVNNIQPRLSPACLHNFGWLVVENGTAAAVTVTVYNNSTYAVILSPDNMDTNVARLANLERINANELNVHTQDVKPYTMPAKTAKSIPQVKLQIKQELAEHGVPPSITQKDAHESKVTRTTNSHTFEHVAQGTALADLALAWKTGKGLFARAKDVAIGLKNKIFGEGAAVGEAGGGAAAAGGALAEAEEGLEMVAMA